MNKKLLVVDDDIHLGELIADALEGEYNVVCASDSEQAYRIATKDAPDIIVLDVHIGNENGIDLCQKLRASQLTKKIPILIFTGHSSSEKMLKSFDVGADDYIEKPVNIEVFKNRINARLRRNKEITSESVVFDDLKLFPERFEIELKGKVHKLSEIEFNLLRTFLLNPNKKISRDEILTTVWNDVQVTERTVDVHISSLRQKLKDFDHTIKALYGNGYILRPNSNSKVS